MNKLLVLILCVALGMGLLTTASISSQRNAWQAEAEKLEKENKKAADQYKKNQEEMEEALASARLERDAYALLQQTMEEEKAALSRQVEQLELALAEALELEDQLTQAHADRDFAQQRLQEALAILMTPAPVSAPTPEPDAGNSLFSAVLNALQQPVNEQTTLEWVELEETAHPDDMESPAPTASPVPFCTPSPTPVG